MKAVRVDIAPIEIDAEEALEEMYITIREREGRVYTDRQVAQLPNIDTGHTFYHEWKMRQRSAKRLITWLEQKQRPLNILEIGCGNGWLSAKLAEIPFVKVAGLDTNRIEIEQARRVFKMANLQFVHKGFSNETFSGKVKFDVIIFAASLQYFPSVKTIIGDAFGLLNSDGEVHVMDTPFYHEDKVEASTARCKKYYEDMGFAVMANHYYHYTLHELEAFKHKVLFDPRGFWNRLTKKDVFYWVMLKA